MTSSMSPLSDTAMVLAAGLGTRMEDLTQTRPKPLIEVCGTPLIDRILDRLTAAGISRAVVNVHHHADMMRQHLAPCREPEIAISDETDELLDTGGGVARALERFGGMPFLALNADVLWLDGRANTLSRLAQNWRDDEMDALLLMCFTVDAIGYDGLGDFMMADDRRLSRREEQPRLTVGIFGYPGAASTLVRCRVKQRVFPQPPLRQGGIGRQVVRVDSRRGVDARGDASRRGGRRRRPERPLTFHGKAPAAASLHDPRGDAFH